MKIDFTGSYAEIQKLLGAKQGAESVQKDRNVFEKTLADISPDASSRANTKTQANDPILPKSVDQNLPGPMASYKFEPPAMKGPEFVPLSPISDGTESVKKPTILEVRRKTDNRSLTELRKDERIQAVWKILEGVAPQQGVDPLLGQAVIAAESSFNPNAISADGHASKGLFQLLDETGRELHKSEGVGDSYDPFNPEQNVQLGMRYLRRLHDTFSQPTELVNKALTVPAANSTTLEKLAVAAFNAGEGRVAGAQQEAMRRGSDPSVYEGIQMYLPKSTQEYVERVMRLKTEFGEDLLVE